MKTLAIRFLVVVGLLVAVTGPTSAELELIKNCTDTQTREIAEVANLIGTNWEEFETFVEAETDLNIRNCMRHRFQKNGKVICEAATGMCRRDLRNPAAGWASRLNRRIHLCPGFLEIVGRYVVENNRKACYAALMAHEFAHTCDRGHRSAERLDNAGFNFYRSKNTVTITLAECGLR